MFRSLIILTIISLLSSCGEQFHLKQSKKHLDKAIEKGYERKADSVYVADTTISHAVRHDTTTILLPGDTITVEKERLIYSVIRDILTDSVFIEVECEADTIIQERLVQIICDPIYIQQTPLEYFGVDKWWEKLLFWLFIAVLAALAVYKWLPF